MERAWDCTLHVVDIASLARFGGRFLRGMHKGAFDAAYDADAMIDHVKRLIASDPATGARALGELALLYASTETPHAYSRDVALSRSGELAVPRRWLTSVEAYITDIVAAYPKIAGRVPRALDQRFSVGAVVSPRDVPAVLAHVDRAVGALTAEDRLRYRPLLDVLRVAAARGLAYWEGADIDVVQTREAWFAALRRSPVQTAPSPLTSAHARPLAIAGERMLIGEHFVLHELETAGFPPAVITHADTQVTAAAFTPWGTELVRMVIDRDARPFKFGYFELPDRTPLPIAPDFAVGLARPTRDGVLLFPQAATQPRPGLRPLLLRPPGTLEPLDLPEPADTERVACEACAFGDGSQLILWDGVPYHWDGASPPRSLGGTLDVPEDVCGAVTLADGSIAGGFGRTLVRIAADGTRTPLLPLDNVLAVLRGGDDALIIVEGDNPDGDVCKLWWPASGELTHVPLAALELSERPCFLYYDATTQLVVAALPQRWHAIAWAELALLRRTTPEPP